MVIQTCSEVFAVLMHLDTPDTLSAETIKALLNGTEHTVSFSDTTLTEPVSNDRTSLPHQIK